MSYVYFLTSVVNALCKQEVYNLIKHCEKCKQEIQIDGDTTFDIFHEGDGIHEVRTYTRSYF